MHMSSCCGGGAPEKREKEAGGAHEHSHSGSGCGMGTGSGTSWLLWAGIGIILAVVIFYTLR